MATRAATPEPDPRWLCLIITLAFAVLVGWRLGIPAKIYFDEVHYVPAARRLIALLPANGEHPLFAKEAIAAAILMLGDHPWVWRLPSAVMGVLGLYAFGRAMWLASGRRFATIAAMLLVASDFAWLVQSRIAMLDMVMAGLAMVALWQIAMVLRLPAAPAWRARAHLALAGVSMGLAFAAKWSVLPLLVLVVAVLAAAWLYGEGGQHDLRRDDRRQHEAPAPIRPLSLGAITLWLGLVPGLVYWASFTPAFFYHEAPLDPLAMLAWHHTMLHLQRGVVQHHPYQSVWWQWVINWRPIWYLYENVDGAQRGVLLLGNPLTMLVGVPATVWCLWAGLARGRWEALFAAAAYGVSLGLWLVSGKPVLFYYHYLLPGTFLMACLALALDALWRWRPRWRVLRECRWGAPAMVATSLALFGWFFPIIAATELTHGPQSFAAWMWLDSWR